MFLEPWTLKYSKMKLTEKKLRQKSFFFSRSSKIFQEKQTSNKTNNKRRIDNCGHYAIHTSSLFYGKVLSHISVFNK